MIKVERAHVRDMGHVTSLELHTQEYPKSTEEMKSYCMPVAGSGKQAYLALITSKQVGHALVDFNKTLKYCMIESIGVHPSFRKAGIGRKLVEKISIDAYVDGLPVRIAVASYLVDDLEDPWNIEQWLWKLGFKAVGVGDECFRYGKLYDFYIFERIK